MTWRQAKEAALLTTLLAVALILYMHVDPYIRHQAGGGERASVGIVPAVGAEDGP